MFLHHSIVVIETKEKWQKIGCKSMVQKPRCKTAPYFGYWTIQNIPFRDVTPKGRGSILAL